MPDASLQATRSSVRDDASERKRPQRASSSGPDAFRLADGSVPSRIDPGSVLVRKDMTPIRPGELFRRRDISQDVRSLDYKLKKLVERGELLKVERGIYFLGEKTRFGMTGPGIRDVLRLLLGTEDFFVSNRNNYNDIDIGTTQLYCVPLVYNQKWEGRRRIDGLQYRFMRGRTYPKEPTLEFMYVDAMNNLDMLAEEPGPVKSNIIRRAGERCRRRDVMAAVRAYGTPQTRAIFAQGGYA